MKHLRLLSSLAVAGVAVGCGPAKVDFSSIQKPAPAPELTRFQPFVGEWEWHAERVVPDAAAAHWTGTAKWDWTLGGTYLRGELSASGEGQSFSSTGYWGWHPKRKTYVWWMLNDWGYPQEGTARFDNDKNLWTMRFEGVGLDGTPSYGTYTVRMVGADTLEWTLDEWADATRCFFKKLEMTGTYRRK